MRKRLILPMLMLCVAAYAEDFGPRFEKGYSQLRNGDPEAALASFNELLTETPDSDLVRYSIAAAEYAKGVKDLEAGGAEAGMQGLTKAKSDFDALSGAMTPFVVRESGFGAANASAQIAKHYNEQEQYKERVEALQTAVAGYEGVLDQYPDHKAAARNLNHTRYLLKKMLQNPPENQDKSKDEGNDPGENGEQDQEQQKGDQPQDQQPEDQQGDQDQDQQEDGQPQDQKSVGKKTDDNANIEAILDSLEDKNREEQKNLRKAKGAPKVVNGKWW